MDTAAVPDALPEKLWVCETCEDDHNCHPADALRLLTQHSLHTLALVDKTDGGDDAKLPWIVFPWERLEAVPLGGDAW